MSDLFKDHKPELTEEEDRLLWQRVRAIPAAPPPSVPDPWWKRLFSLPAVRYGAPAFAVLLAAVVYVVERAPEPTLRVAAPARVETTAPEEPDVVHRVLPPPVVVEGEVRSRPASPTDAPQGNPAATVAKKEAERAIDKDETAARNDNFAQPPALLKAKAADTAPAPVAETAPAPAPPSAATAQEGARERKQAVGPQSSAGATAPQASPQWGNVKSNYRDGGPETAQRLMATQPDAVSELISGHLPDPSMLADHPVLRSSSFVPYDRAKMAVPPGEFMTPEQKSDFAILHQPGFGDSDPAVQAAAIALVFERALGRPEAIPRSRIEALLVYARATEAQANKVDKPGATRLVAMLEGALKAWP